AREQGPRGRARAGQDAHVGRALGPPLCREARAHRRVRERGAGRHRAPRAGVARTRRRAAGAPPRPALLRGAHGRSPGRRARARGGGLAPVRAHAAGAVMTAYGVDVLAFGAHPDDVELFCGGTLLRLAELGYTTAVVDLTRGEK